MWNRLVRWYIKHRIKKEVKRIRKEGSMLNKILTLDFAQLKGWRTVIGGAAYLVDLLLNSSMCVDHPAACAALKTLSGWFLLMGIRGK